MLENLIIFFNKTINDLLDWLFKKEINKFDTLSRELKHQHDSPSSYDIKDQLRALKEHLNGHKIPTYIQLNENNKIEKIGVITDYNQDE